MAEDRPVNQGLLAGLNISEIELRYFESYLHREGSSFLFTYLDDGRVVTYEQWDSNYRQVPSGPGIWLAGTVVPVMARHLFLFHSAVEAICFGKLYPAWLARPGNSVFAALGLLPQAAQLSWLATIYTKARLHLAFGNELMAAVIDCKTALWHKGMDVSFNLDGNLVSWYWKGKPFNLSEQDFSFYRFQQSCGLRIPVRTHKPPAAYGCFIDVLTF